MKSRSAVLPPSSASLWFLSKTSLFFPLWAVSCRPQTSLLELGAVCGASSRQSCSHGPLACNGEPEGCTRGRAFYKQVTGKLTFLLLFLLDFNLLAWCVCVYRWCLIIVTPVCRSQTVSRRPCGVLLMPV